MNERAAVNTKGQQPKILFRRVKRKQIIYRIFLSPPPLLLEKGWDKPSAMDFWFSRHLNCLLGKFKYYGTSPSTFIWPKMPKKMHIFLWEKYVWQNIDIFSHFRIGITCFFQKLTQNKLFLFQSFVSLIFIAMIGTKHIYIIFIFGLIPKLLDINIQ